MENDVTQDNQPIDPATAAAQEATAAALGEDEGQHIRDLAEKITSAENILVALPKNPTLDTLSAALGLTILLDRNGKHVTAIYSGKTPSALEFLRPEDTFQDNTDSLQDFIVVLNKSKADHLRYQVEGDFVKVYITPYKGRISEDDLDFEYGGYNVDLVISVDVDSGEELDAALTEYGRILHDATSINITVGAPGRFADEEFNDLDASSTCELMVRLIRGGELGEITDDVATAFLTGIMSATERFTNSRVSADTMSLASDLMKAGADQQLVSINVLKEGMVDEDDEPTSSEPEDPAPTADSDEETNRESETPSEATETVSNSTPNSEEEPVDIFAAPNETSTPEPDTTEAPTTPSDSATSETPTIPSEPAPTTEPTPTENPALSAAPAAPSEPEAEPLELEIPTADADQIPEVEVVKEAPAEPTPLATPTPTLPPAPETPAIPPETPTTPSEPAAPAAPTPSAPTEAELAQAKLEELVSAPPKTFAEMMAEELAQPLPVETATPQMVMNNPLAGTPDGDTGNIVTESGLEQNLELLPPPPAPDTTAGMPPLPPLEAPVAPVPAPETPPMVPAFSTTPSEPVAPDFSTPSLPTVPDVVPGMPATETPAAPAPEVPATPPASEAPSVSPSTENPALSAAPVPLAPTDNASFTIPGV